MLCDLFDEESQTSSNSSVSYGSKRTSGKDRPEAARKSCNLCGLKNQGATCYLNTLIQTLFLTPEFRDRFFSLSPDELGLVPSTLANAKVRVIPIELQRLFANLLLLDQDSCSTTRLTNSFGWSNNESFQQHDVQELNRILFSAIESSLVNTKESQLIQQLYRGTIMNKIHCLSCHNVKLREEEFLDLPIAVQGLSNLEVSLMNSFIVREQLNGNNQYNCEVCNKYCDAEKYCQLKTLPDILTLSLLRFTYDMKTWQRIKVLDKFEFPLELDLHDYLEDEFKKTVSEDYSKYELYSVIIHSGSAYGGHYHTYIKDVQKIGKWDPNGAEEPAKKDKKSTKGAKKQVTIVEPVEVEINQIITSNLNQKEIHLVRENLEDEELDYLKYTEPKELLKAFLYEKYQYKSVRIDNMCAELLKVTGMSWNKSFKGRCGPINKFLKKHDDAFEITDNEQSVKLLQHDAINEILSRNYDDFCAQKKLDSEFSEKLVIETPQQLTENIENKDETTEKEVVEDDSDHWFDFNDCNVRPIRSSTIKTQFEGKESAYMLFYRRKGLKSDPKAALSQWLLNEIESENKALREMRQHYDNSNNEMSLMVTLDTDIYLKEPLGIVNLLDESANKISLKVDKRLTVSQLGNELVQYFTTCETLPRREIALNYLLSNQDSLRYLTLKRTPNGMFASGHVSSDAPISSLEREPFHSVLVTANLDKYSVGDEHAPLMLRIKYFDAELNYREVNEVVTRATSLQHLKEILCKYRAGAEKHFSLISVKKESKCEEADKKWQFDFFDYSNNTKRLSEFSIKNGDFVIIENANFDLNFANVANNSTQTSTKAQSDFAIKVRIISCVNQADASDSLPFNDLQVSREDTFEQTKIAALSLFLLDSVKYDACHLRYVNLDSASSSTFPHLISDLIAEIKQNNQQILTGFRLNESQTLVDFLFETQKEPVEVPNELNSVVFVLCHGRAHISDINEIAVKFYLQLDVKHFSDEVKCELIISRDSKIREVVEAARKAMALAPEVSYYLKSVNWMGEPDKILNAVDKSCAESGIDEHTQFLCVVKGDLIAEGFVKLNMWLCKLVGGVRVELLSEDLVKSKLYCSADSVTSGEFDFLESFVMSNEMKLEDFRAKIGDFLVENSQMVTQLVGSSCWLSDEGVKFRLRLMKKSLVKGKGANRKHNFEIMKMRKALFDEHKSLRQMNFQSNEVDVAIEVLAEEETSLNQGIMLVDCMQFDLVEKNFKCLKEICWNTNNGATVSSLKQSIIKEFDLEPSSAFHLSIVKRQHEKFDWILLKDISVGEESSQKATTAKGKGKKGAAHQKQGAKTNLRSAPFYLDDGDVIAFCVDNLASTTPVSSKDFLTPLDLEMKKQQTKVKSSFDLFSSDDAKGGRRKATNRRAEVGITIITDDYN